MKDYAKKLLDAELETRTKERRGRIRALFTDEQWAEEGRRWDMAFLFGPDEEKWPKTD